MKIKSVTSKTLLAKTLSVVTFTILTCHPALSVFTSDFKFFDDTLYRPPQVQNQALNKKVNFSFKDTKLSYVFLLLSKVGEFNVVLPEQFERNITITIAQQRVIDAIEDICKLTNLSYEFKGNTMLLTQKNMQNMSFVSIPVVHLGAEKVVESLNNVLFRQLALLQNDKLTKPHAAIDPSKNAVIVVASQEQLELAKKYIQELDSPPTVKIYTPSYLGFLDARKLISINFAENNTLKLKRFEQNSLLLKGSNSEVIRALELFKAHDHAPRPVKFTIKTYGILVDQTADFVKKNNLIDYSKLQKINKSKFYDKNTGLIDFLHLLEEQPNELNRNQELDYNDVKIKARSNLIEAEKLTLTAFNDTLASLDLNQDIACKILSPDDLKVYKKLTKFTKKDYSVLVLCVEF